MQKAPFMLVSLKEDKAKKLSHVLSNKTATKILEYLAGKDATESQIAKKLKIPLSTVNYNMKQLVDAKLVLCEEFHYSEKGKEVNHYKLANKYIIIAPQEEDESFLDHLKKFMPAAAILAGTALVLQFLQKNAPAMVPTAQDSALVAESAKAAPMITDMVQKSITSMTQIPWWQSADVNLALIGAGIMLVVVVLVTYKRT